MQCLARRAHMAFHKYSQCDHGDEDDNGSDDQDDDYIKKYSLH